MQIPTLIGGLVILSVLVACAETPLAPVDDRTASSASAISGNLPASSREPIVTQLSLGSPYTVRRGDTLYSIAFRLGIDFKSLARRNAIVAPYTIFPGQVLATDPQRAKPQASLAKVEKEAVETGKILSPIQRPSSSNSKPLASKSAASATGRTHPDLRWLWPSAGKIVRKNLRHRARRELISQVCRARLSGQSPRDQWFT